MQNSVEGNEIEVDGHIIKFRKVTYVKERDGIRLPHVHKQIFCTPPAPLDLVMNHSTHITEVVGGVE